MARNNSYMYLLVSEKKVPSPGLFITCKFIYVFSAHTCMIGLALELSIREAVSIRNLSAM